MSYNSPAYRLFTRDFSAGYQTTPEIDTLPDGASPDAKNCLLGSVEVRNRRRAVVTKRQGSRLLNPSVMASQHPVDLFEFLRETTDGELLAVCNGSLYKYDNVDTFTPITGGTGFSTTAPVRMASFKGNAFVCDGVQNLRYNGTAALPVGTDAPTSAPTLIAGAGTRTGTYEGYAVWYDSTMDHESSPPLNSDGSLALSAQVAIVAQGRTWGIPTGTPTANYDYWRVYCRRVDTNERNYFRSVQVAIGFATVTENTSDAGRTNIGPAPKDNDKPPAFALMAEYKGFRLGVKATSSDIYVSKQYDPESQHPSNVFAVGGKGDNKAVTTIKVYGEECLVQKPRKSYRLTGDVLPFKFTPIDGSLGNVSQESSLEVNGQFYAWDEAIGPYRTDLSSWTPLADGRIESVVQAVNRLALSQIRAEHWSQGKLILWAVPDSSTRKRTLLAYNYMNDSWLPPITGLEYYSLAQYTTTAGAIGLYCGDYWGRVYELFSGDIEGVPSGDTSAAIQSATSSSINCVLVSNPPSFYTTGDGLAGMPVAVLSPDGAWQFVRVLSNTAMTIVLDTINGPTLDPVPDTTGDWTVYVGPIEAYWKTPVRDNDAPERRKLARWFLIDLRMSSPGHSLEVNTFIDGADGAITSLVVTPSGGLVWGVGLWGTGTWRSGTDTVQKHRLGRSYTEIQFEFRNFYPNEPWSVLAYGLGADPMRNRMVRSA